jgi:N-acetylglucosamine kinase-like BadF-type ATPase
MRYVVGIDAGGTKTVGLKADEHGEVVARAKTSGANLQTHGELEVEKVFDRVLEDLGTSDVAALCLGIAGVDRPRDENIIRNILRRLGHRETARVVNDAVIALTAGAPDGVGIVILAGTGSIAFGQDPSGRTARSGGYGFVLADEGSGYWFGHQALRAATRAADGRGEPTLLQEMLFDSLGVKNVGELVPLVYVKGLPKHRIAALAPFVQRAADAGDSLSKRLLQEGGAELARAAAAVAGQLDFQGRALPVLLAGGVFRACPSLVEGVLGRLDVPGAKGRMLAEEPAQGAVTLALQMLKGASPRAAAPGLRFAE